ncbi:MAG: membrane protein insertion efficiency factor YidD [Deltaproteobacteria bacterium]|nr:membrane protein insertion efficiency factor YidD [Deltaproteobacteria bacterium]
MPSYFQSLGAVGDNFLRGLSLGVIALYRGVRPSLGLLFFPSHSCRFWPTCSAYAWQLFQKERWSRAMVLSLRRLLRCHPFQEGGVDLPPISLERRS